MMKKKQLPPYLLIIFLLPTAIQAQNGPVTAGGDASGTGGNVSYSIGQVDYRVAVSSQGHINQGLQQPYEISEITGIETKSVRLDLRVFPNPTEDFLTLRITGQSLETMQYSIYALDGKLIREKENVTTETTTILLNSYAKGAYTLSVFDRSKHLKSFSIIKN